MDDTIRQNVSLAIKEIMQRTKAVIFTRMGDHAVIGQQRIEVERFMLQVQQHSRLFNAEELAGYQDTVAHMLQYLQHALTLASDPPDSEVLSTSRRIRKSKFGRSRIEISRGLLSELLEHRDLRRLGEFFKCSARTVRRRALEYGLRNAGHPVCQTVESADGATLRIFTSSTPPFSSVTDEELDNIVHGVLQAHPNMGHQMLRGALHGLGCYVSHKRQDESHRRVHGPSNAFGDRRIQRRVYKVPGPNSLWHHDGQHGLIKYKIVFHCFIDGFSRMIVGLGVNTNNRASTVLDLFLQATARSGVPSRVRGDHGTENLLVCAWMEAKRGLNRGSYLWGRSVHNTRIERLWFDLTRDFGRKWKTFFIDLEDSFGMDPTIPEHIWLLHHLFLPCIKQDAAEWVEFWNWHKMSLGRGNSSQSPREMWVMGMYKYGPRGIEELFHSDDAEDNSIDANSYGVDPEIFQNRTLARHFLQHNASDGPHTASANPFLPNSGPHHMSDVPCEAPGCPFTEAQIRYLDLQLSQRVDVLSRDMSVRRFIWTEAVSIAADILGHDVL